jgi:hypothetical protein
MSSIVVNRGRAVSNRAVRHVAKDKVNVKVMCEHCVCGINAIIIAIRWLRVRMSTWTSIYDANK